MESTVGEKLKKLRIALKMGQEDAAESAGIRESTLSRIESGERMPSFASLKGLCEAYGVSADYLMDLRWELTALADNLALEIKQCAEVLDLVEMAEFYDEEALACVRKLESLLAEYLHIRGLDNE